MPSTDPELSLLEWVAVARASVGGSEFVLSRRGQDWVVRVDQRVLMSNRVHLSELVLAEAAIERAERRNQVLVGGLGLGYTLRAALDELPPASSVTVVELVAALVDWNRTLLADLNEHALGDPRCSVVIGDVYDHLTSANRRFDVILLDVDNGPRALSQATNQRLYTDAGAAVCFRSLTPGGVLGVWATGPDERYAARLRRFGFDVAQRRVRAHDGSPAAHVIFLATKP